MDENEISIRQKLKDDFEHYASRALFIRTKEANVEPLILNKAQKYIHERLETQLKATGKVRALVLKGRQQGVSTLIGARFFWKVTHRKNVKAFILTHQEKATEALFNMTVRYYNNCPSLIKPIASSKNAKQLDFGGLDSGYAVGTAGSKDVGRGSTINYLHGSEVAFWPMAEEHSTGILQAVPSTLNTEVILESTAQGMGNFFHRQWQLAEAGQSDYQAIFVPWYWQDEYRKPIVDPEFKLSEEEQELKELYGLDDEQINWRRYKIFEFTGTGMDGQKLFKQEYPCNSTEAFQVSGFDSFIQPELVMRARKCTEAQGYGHLLLGVDPARYGDDRTAIVFRQGRVASEMLCYEKKDTMEVAGIVHNLILKYKPFKVFIDVIGIGAGVVDRLLEIGHECIVPVNSASKPLDENRYGNKRAEMWGLMKEWLEDYPTKIPDSDTLHADLCAPNYKPDSSGRMLIEKKESIKKRGLRSPDEADALAMTFAQPIMSNDTTVYDTLIRAGDIPNWMAA